MIQKIELTKMEALELIVLLLDKRRQMDTTINNLKEFQSDLTHYAIPSRENFDVELAKTNDLINKIRVVFFED